MFRSAGQAEKCCSARRWGRAVDGDHLYGSLARVWDEATRTRRPKGPSGDGTEGGTFVSWFRLIEGAATGGDKK